MAGNLVELTESNFQSEVIESGEPVLVDFWAPWCGPCKMLTPTIEALAAEYAGKVKVAKLNTDDAQQVAVNFRIESIPTMIVFKGGEPVDRMMGLQPKERIADMLNKHLA
ncbi:MAG: thioredoxin [Planctomycetaceae bacterium]|nr:thioredoxin [Planctomycetaceae bacterium]